MSKPTTLLRRVEPGLFRVYGDLVQMSARQRRAIFNQVLALSTTNCSWITYRAREFLLEMVLETAGPRQRKSFKSALAKRLGSGGVS